jgi:hypothetical protein
MRRGRGRVGRHRAQPRPLPRRSLRHRGQAPAPRALLLHRLRLLRLLPRRGRRPIPGRAAAAAAHQLAAHRDRGGALAPPRDAEPTPPRGATEARRAPELHGLLFPALGAAQARRRGAARRQRRAAQEVRRLAGEHLCQHHGARYKKDMRPNWRLWFLLVALCIVFSYYGFVANAIFLRCFSCSANTGCVLILVLQLDLHY